MCQWKLVLARRHDRDLPQHAAEGDEVGVVDVGLAVDHHSVLLQEREAVICGAGADEVAPGNAGDLGAEVRSERGDGDGHAASSVEEDCRCTIV
jgi:hypothetical protein